MYPITDREFRPKPAVAVSVRVRMDAGDPWTKGRKDGRTDGPKLPRAAAAAAAGMD